MTRTTWTLALAFLAAPLSPAVAAKPQPAPQLVAVIEGGWQSCTALFALDDQGAVYVDCGVTGNWQVAGHVSGTPVSMTWNAYPRNLLVTMANGEVWAAPITPTPPYAFTLLSNVFTSAGAPTRLPTFPDLAPREDARPILTNEPESDAPGMVK